MYRRSTPGRNPGGSLTRSGSYGSIHSGSYAEIPSSSSASPVSSRPQTPAVEYHTADQRAEGYERMVSGAIAIPQRTSIRSPSDTSSLLSSLHSSGQMRLGQETFSRYHENPYVRAGDIDDGASSSGLLFEGIRSNSSGSWGRSTPPLSQLGNRTDNEYIDSMQREFNRFYRDSSPLNMSNRADNNPTWPLLSSNQGAVGGTMSPRMSRAMSTGNRNSYGVINQNMYDMNIAGSPVSQSRSSSVNLDMYNMDLNPDFTAARSGLPLLSSSPQMYNRQLQSSTNRATDTVPQRSFRTLADMSPPGGYANPDIERWLAQAGAVLSQSLAGRRSPSPYNTPTGSRSPSGSPVQFRGSTPSSRSPSPGAYDTEYF